MSEISPEVAIEQKPFEGETYDVMNGAGRWEVKVHDHGLVALIDVMPRLAPVGKTADYAIVQAARVQLRRRHEAGQRRHGAHSLSRPASSQHAVRDGGVQVPSRDADLRRPPVDSASHGECERILGSIQRRPRSLLSPKSGKRRKQSASNRQGGEEPVDPTTADDFLKYLDKVEADYENYQGFIDKGVAREIARIALPASVYTEWYWKIDLHNLFHFLSLRMDAHAQQEIRDYANAMYA